ncbi:alcohol dehydrogenase catalytic domain-containing protein [Mycobacterium sp. CBMA293]|uniref:alcohol dehydrogenase catalytic domain-containing protein n=1 Tax=unclassified Mycolicibacterium TaxID=2636767 RepID=UPI0012DBE117|nr:MULTISPECIES: alcohol dehydrogenase catalytic domain-containing protein [unclassified Mycolicibacterium]MUL49011.1 alcohol dehydrogenase catalytic domain-containing protein [Mycolicibacterium sp. CBMA 360]MUL58574.1 alcohol dehydrogenase catalytic domain-containing protein [Mycolicibacterium sp. CBMA 335]MUL74032.1 alcohol dehydrogenase catalytic domain-containing protein [Mycolicibacterium sp. CBMA 311]MUL93457.1 alcohol dehydrogenase catalytic domain-containing protein [Mycolicibacterium s
MVRAAVIEELAQPLVVHDVPEPLCPADGAIVRVMANGICRTDWALWSGNFWTGGPRIAAPFVLGHEFAGVVEEVGSEVRCWQAGDRVTFPMNPGDGMCGTCRAGHQHVCERGGALVPGVSYWGAFAEYVAVRFADVNLVALPESLGFVAAASLGCRYIAAFHGLVDQARVRPGEWVAIYGAGGGMGLAAVQIATATGANVIAVDISDDKLAAARRLGAVHTTKAPAPEAASEIVELTGGGAHVSVDAIGLAQTCQASVHSLRPRGRHLQLGHTVAADGGQIAVPIDLMLIKELEFLSAFGMAAHQFGPMLAMIESGRLNPDEVVSRTVGLNDVTSVLQSMESFDTSGVVVIDRF